MATTTEEKKAKKAAATEKVKKAIVSGFAFSFGGKTVTCKINRLTTYNKETGNSEKDCIYITQLDKNAIYLFQSRGNGMIKWEAIPASNGKFHDLQEQVLLKNNEKIIRSILTEYFLYSSFDTFSNSFIAYAKTNKNWKEVVEGEKLYGPANVVYSYIENTIPSAN